MYEFLFIYYVIDLFVDYLLIKVVIEYSGIYFVL